MSKASEVLACLEEKFTAKGLEGGDLVEVEMKDGPTFMGEVERVVTKSPHGPIKDPAEWTVVVVSSENKETRKMKVSKGNRIQANAKTANQVRKI